MINYWDREDWPKLIFCHDCKKNVGRYRWFTHRWEAHRDTAEPPFKVPS